VRFANGAIQDAAWNGCEAVHEASPERLNGLGQQLGQIVERVILGRRAGRWHLGPLRRAEHDSGPDRGIPGVAEGPPHSPISAPSNRPEQSFQFVQISGFLLPTLNAYLLRQIAEPMQQKKRHESSGQRRVRVRLRIPKALQETADPARYSLSHEGARTKQVVLSPARHDVAKIDQSRK